MFTGSFASHIIGNGIVKEDNSCDASLSEASSGDTKERSCDSLIMCIVTTLNQGLRNGGGIGDILRAPSSKVSILFGFNISFCVIVVDNDEKPFLH